MTTDCSLNYKFNTWKFQAQTWGEHVVYRNSFRHSEQFLYTTCSRHFLQKEELPTKIYLYAIFVYSIIPHLKWIGIGTFDPWSESLDSRLIELPEVFRLFFVDLFTFPNFFSFKFFFILANFAFKVRLPKYPGKLLLCSTRFTLFRNELLCQLFRAII